MILKRRLSGRLFFALQFDIIPAGVFHSSFFFVCLVCFVVSTY